MIRYTLKCDNDHSFESWFQSAAAFDGLAGAGHVACPVCDSHRVEKTLMAPSVTAGRSDAPPTDGALSTATPQEMALAKFRREMEEKSEYVGPSFAAEARAIHEGESPRRVIHGEARLADARKLLEDGVPVMPLPFLPKRNQN